VPEGCILFFNSYYANVLSDACLVQKQQIKYQLYGLWFNLQTVQVEDGDEMVKKVLKKMQSE
jgi:hypothetical protein